MDKDIPPSNSFDAFIVTDLGNPQREFEKLTKLFGTGRVYAPEILNISSAQKTVIREGNDD